MSAALSLLGGSERGLLSIHESDGVHYNFQLPAASHAPLVLRFGYRPPRDPAFVDHQNVGYADILQNFAFHAIVYMRVCGRDGLRDPQPHGSAVLEARLLACRNEIRCGRIWRLLIRRYRRRGLEDEQETT